MEHATTLIAIFHIAVAVLLTAVVLIQDSKGGGMGGAFGGGGSQTLFGATGAATFLVKVTRGLAFVFALTSMSLVYLVSHKNNRSVVDTLPAAPLSAPATPVTPAAPGK